MSEKYVRPTISGWLGPAMVGPWISMSLGATLYAFLGPEYKFIPRWGVFAIAMIVAALLSAVYVLIQVLVDVALLALRQRQFATGRKAWLMSLGGPLAVLGSYGLLSPVDLYKYGPWAVAGAILIPMLVATVGVRVFLGPKIEKAKR